MSSECLNKYRKYARNTRLLLVPVGLWPIRDSTLGYRFLSTFAGASLLLLNFTALYYCYINITDINRVTRSFSWCISIWTLLMKVIFFMAHRDRLLYLNEMLGRTFEEELEYFGLESVLLQRLSVFTGVYYAMILALATAFSFFAIIPLIFMINERKALLVYPGKYPFNFEAGGTIYYLIYVYEVSLAFVFFCIGCGTDTAFGFWVFQICGQLRLLAFKFRQLRPGEGYSIEIKYCLDKHEMILRCRDHIQRVFGFIVIWLYITISLVLCEYIYKMSKMTLKFSFWQSVMFFTFATKFLQAFTYAYCGSIIELESEKLLQAIYDCDWPGTGNKRIMSDVLSLLSQRSMEFRSYNYFLVSMDMFLKIVNAAVSYFFLLQTLEAT